MADGITITDSDLKIARSSTYMQLEALVVPIQEELQAHGDIEEAINSLGLREYLENSIRVRAAEFAYSRMQSNALFELLQNTVL